MRNIASKSDNVGDVLTAGEFNSNQNELENIVISAGISLDPAAGADTDLNMLGKAVAAYASAGCWYTDGGSANAYVLSRSTNLKSPPGYYDGMEIVFTPANANTGASTVNVSSLGVKSIVGANEKALIKGDIIADEPVMAVYDSGLGSFKLVEMSNQVSTGFKNHVINGNFDIWQRGTTQSGTVNSYGSDDRWSNVYGNTTRTHYRSTFTVGQTAVPGEPKYYSTTNLTVAGVTTDSTCYKEHKIEDARTFAGETITLSFWAKANSSKNICTEFLQYFAGAEAASYGIGITTHALTNVWQKFTVTTAIPSISGKVISANSYFSLVFWFEAGSDWDSRTNSLGHQTGVFDIAQVQIERGRKATTFEKRPVALELLLCQRYYQKTYDIDTVPGTETDNGARDFFTDNVNSSVYSVHYDWQLAVEMQTLPTLVTYSPVTGDADKVRLASGDFTPESTEVSTKSITIRATDSVASTQRWMRFHATVDAEL